MVASGAFYYLGSNASYGANGNNSSASTTVAGPVVANGVLAGTTATEISSGGFLSGGSYVCAISTTNEGFCWGYGDGWTLGNGSDANSSVPVAISQVARQGYGAK